MTLLQESRKKKCCVTLKSLGLNSKMAIPNLNLDEHIFHELVFNTPTSANPNYGIKFKAIRAINKRTVDIFTRKILSSLQLRDDSIFVFDSFEGKSSKTIFPNRHGNNRSDKLLFILKVENSSLVNSLYLAIRNSLAHGNIIKDRYDMIYFYSLSKGSNRKPDEEKRIKFLLKTKDINSIKVFVDVLHQYIAD